MGPRLLLSSERPARAGKTAIPASGRRPRVGHGRRRADPAHGRQRAVKAPSLTLRQESAMGRPGPAVTRLAHQEVPWAKVAPLVAPKKGWYDILSRSAVGKKTRRPATHKEVPRFLPSSHWARKGAPRESVGC